MEFLLQIIAEMLQSNEEEIKMETTEELELVNMEEEESIENIFGMMHFH